MSTATHPLHPEIAALLAQCRATHDADVASVEQRTRRLAEILVRRIAFGGATRHDFELAITYGCVPEPDEPADRFEARRRGLLGGLINGICAVSAR